MGDRSPIKAFGGGFKPVALDYKGGKLSESGLGRVLLIGGSGMLGRAWQHLLISEGIEFDAPASRGRKKLDLKVPSSISRWVSGDYDCVINCAGWTDVDGAESNPAQAKLINGTAVGEMADRCLETGALLVHYSTDYVFSGTSDSAFRVDDPTEPINEYGHSKLLGERRLLASECKRLLIRTSWLYAPWGHNFVKTIADLSRQKPVLRVVNDQLGRPTSCEHLARQTLSLIRKGTNDIYHVSDGGQCTWYEFAKKIAELTSPNCDIQPCDSDEYPRPALRPDFSVLDLSETQRITGPMPHWHQNLGEVLCQLRADLGETERVRV